MDGETLTQFWVLTQQLGGKKRLRGSVPLLLDQSGKACLWRGSSLNSSLTKTWVIHIFLSAENVTNIPVTKRGNLGISEQNCSKLELHFFLKKKKDYTKTQYWEEEKGNNIHIMFVRGFYITHNCCISISQLLFVLHLNNILNPEPPVRQNNNVGWTRNTSYFEGWDQGLK